MGRRDRALELADGGEPVSGIEATEQQLEAPRIDEETATAARRTVAAHALDAGDCVQLFDMLGIRPGGPVATVETDVAEVDLTKFRHEGEEFVPVADLRMLFERIHRDTGMSQLGIARRAKVNPSTVASALAPASTRKVVRRDMYQAVLQLAQELSA